MELGRVTVVDWKGEQDVGLRSPLDSFFRLITGKVVLDKLKKPEHPVVDYNTAFVPFGLMFECYMRREK